MQTRLGLDLGTNSIGWALLRVEDGKPAGIIKMGSRIFPDGRNPKDKSSLAVARRLARQQRRRRDRYLKRQKRLMKTLIERGLMPADENNRKALESLDPYELRAKGLDHPLAPHELGRALFHISRRRGFKSNRKTDKGADDDTGKVKSAINKTRQQIESSGSRTYGEWLNKRHMELKGVRARSVGAGAQSEYELYADRELIDEEIKTLWRVQQGFKLKECTDEALRSIRDVVLFQRDLLPVDPGKCTLEVDQPRAPLADLRVQQFRIYQELNNLSVVDEDLNIRNLSLEERDRVASELQKKAKLTFAQISKLLRLSEKAQFNLESETRGYLKGNLSSAVLAKEKHFGKVWHSLPIEEQSLIVERLIGDDDEAPLVEFLVEKHGLPAEQARATVTCRLPEGYSRLSAKAIGEILPNLKAQVITYDKAALAAGYNHSDFYTGEFFQSLPYYGQILERYTSGPIETSSNADEAKYGRIANPTVHIALNELRKVINGLLKRYGHPDEIVVEVARDLKISQTRKKEIIKLQKENQKNNEQYAEALQKLGLANNYHNRQRFKLWYELGSSVVDRRCPFSGERISIERLFSPEIEVEHIIPFAQCLDDSLGNKTLSVRKANRDKGERTPHQAFGGNLGGYNWDDILDRADHLPSHKRARFAPDAAEKFANQDAWLARQLNDTAYISRVSRQYLTAVCNKDNVRVVPGRLTALLRNSLSLNRLIGETAEKERSDHRHHAIDALVVALTDRRLLMAASSHSKWAREHGMRKLLDEFPTPWKGFPDEAKKQVNSIAISHKPDHGVEGALHNDTAYGIVEGPDEKGVSTVVYRKNLDALKPKDICIIRDITLANKIRDYTEKSDQPFEHALKKFAEENNIHRCRVIEKLSVVAIRDKAGDVYKGYKGDGNYCYEIYELDSGKWAGGVISSFEANQVNYRRFCEDKTRFRSESFSGHPLIMRICPNDIIAITQERRVLMRVVNISAGKISLAPISESNVDARNRDPADPFKYMTKSPNALKPLTARRVFIDPIGQVKDPGVARVPPGS